MSKTSISFLDTCVYIDENRRLQTTLHIKPTDTHNYLHYKSAHPRHPKNSLPHSQGHRLRRICSGNKDLTNNCIKMEENFIRPGYYKEHLQQQIGKAISTPRDSTLRKTKKDSSKRIPLITTFNSTIPQVGKILRERWDILNIKPKFRELFSEPRIIAFRRCKNLRDIIGSNTITNNRVSRKQATKTQVKFCSPCNTVRSLCCINMARSNSFTSINTGRTFMIFHQSNCKSKNVIYLHECTRCRTQYVGKSELPFHYRINLYRSRIKTIHNDKLLPVEKHFKEYNHNFDKDATFTIIERIKMEITENVTKLLETREDNWIIRLQTLSPFGLNNKLNHPSKL